MLIAGGESHKTGQAATRPSASPALEAWARERFDVRSIEYRWSTQDNVPVDGAAVHRAARARSDAALRRHRVHQVGPDQRHGGGDDPHRPDRRARQPVGRPLRLDRVQAAAPRRGELVKENANVGRALRRRPPRPAGRRARSGTLRAGGGRDRAATARGRSAAYRDDDGTLHAVSPVCTHLGCQVKLERRPSARGTAHATARASTLRDACSRGRP